MMEPDMSKSSLGAWCSRLSVGSTMPLQQEDSIFDTARGFVPMPICSALLALQVGMTWCRRVQLMKARLHSTLSSATLWTARCVAALLAPGRGLHCMKSRAWVTVRCGAGSTGQGEYVQEPRNKQARSSGIQEATTSTTVAG